MARPLDPALRLRHAAFLKALARTGNVRATARDLRLNRATLNRRRASDPVFAARWDAALAVAHAWLDSAREREADAPITCGRARDPAHLVQRRTGKLQLRADGKARRLDRAAQQQFLAALSATAKIRLSARATGFAHSTFYTLARRDPGFAREMQLALEMGYERLETALIESFTVEAHEHDAWRHNDPPPIPSMTPEQALQQLYLHHKTAKLWAEAPYMNPKRGETSEMWSMRRGTDYTAAQARTAERLRIAATDAALEKALRRVEWRQERVEVRLEPHAGSGAGRETAKARPASAEPTTDDAGFARGGPMYHPERALFGGWRIEDMRRKMGEG